MSLMLKEAVLGGKHSADDTAVADLNVLSAQFERLKIKIRQLIDALKAQHVSLVKLNESRFMVAKRVAALAENGEVESQAGTVPTVGEDPNDSYLTYMGIHHSLSARHKMYTERFLTHVVEYAIEWEKVIVARVSASLKQAERLRRDQDHYRGKVDNIQRDAGKIISRGRELDPKLSEKLERNEEKLRNSQKEYQKFRSDLCLLMAEVTEKSWKDLHPILLKLIQFDTTLVSDEKKILSTLSSVEGMLKQIAVKHGLKPENRLKDLESLSPTLISSVESDADIGKQKEGDSDEDAKSMPGLLSQEDSNDSAKENTNSKISQAPSTGNKTSIDSILASLDKKEPLTGHLANKVRSNISTVKEEVSKIENGVSFQSKGSSTGKGTKAKLPSKSGLIFEMNSSKNSYSSNSLRKDSQLTPTQVNSQTKHKKASYSSFTKSNYKGVKAVISERNARDSSPTPRTRDSPRSQHGYKGREDPRSHQKYNSKSKRNPQSLVTSPFENFLLCGAGNVSSESYNDDYTVEDTVDNSLETRSRGYW